MVVSGPGGGAAAAAEQRGASPFPRGDPARELAHAWVEGYVGFRWRPCAAADLQGERSVAQVLMLMQKARVASL